MIPEEIAKKALDKLKVYSVKLNEAEHEEALNWLKTQILEYGEQQRQASLDNFEAIFDSFEVALLLWKRVIDNPLMHTKAQRDKATVYMTVLTKVVEDLKSLFPV